MVMAEIGRKHLHLKVLCDREFGSQFLGFLFDEGVFGVNRDNGVRSCSHDEWKRVDFGDASVSITDGGGEQNISMDADENGGIGFEPEAVRVDFDKALVANKPNLNDFIEMCFSVERLSNRVAVSCFLRLSFGGLVGKTAVRTHRRTVVFRPRCEFCGTVYFARRIVAIAWIGLITLITRLITRIA